VATYGPVLLPAYFATDADFRTWVAGIRAALEAVGMVRTADTGQIDTATVVKPAATLANQGYDIFRLDDALQASCPVFLKIEYGSGGAADRPGLFLSHGQGSNGAGALTGTRSTSLQFLAANSRPIGSQLPVYASGDGSSVALMVNLDANQTMGLFLDRPRLADGSCTAEGFFHWCGASAGTQRWGVIPQGGQYAQYSNTSSTQQPLFPTVGQSRWGDQAALYPLLMCVAGRPRLGKMAYCYSLADVPPLVPFTAEDYLGEERTLLPIGSALIGSLVVYASQTQYGLAILWE
jgi:hypothetical protein